MFRQCALAVVRVGECICSTPKRVRFALGQRWARVVFAMVRTWVDRGLKTVARRKCILKLTS
jgi:hypothetical protein